MNHAACVLVICALLLKLTRSWVFTEVKYDPRFTKVELEYSGNEEENEIMPYGQERINLIYPGTKWCGSGDVADDYDDLGPSKEADKCCRKHDHCPDTMTAGESKHNLTNNAFYTKLSCDCDLEFRQCLHKANTTTAQHVGKMYFNVIGTQCFREDFPIKGCLRHSGWLKKKCVKYSFDEEGQPLYQWFDVPNY